jgi:hypothetical protein
MKKRPKPAPRFISIQEVKYVPAEFGTIVGVKIVSQTRECCYIK